MILVNQGELPIASPVLDRADGYTARSARPTQAMVGPDWTL